MRLSIIIPYYNADAYIGRMLDSLLDQDLGAGEYEIIVVDDGSMEEPTVLKDYVARFQQIQYHRIAHAGLSPARNHGLSKAQGDWLYFCDADDFLQRRVLGGIIDTAEAHGLEMVCARYLNLRPSDPIPEPRRNFMSMSPVQTGLEYMGDPPSWFSWGVWNYLIRRSVIDAAALTFEPVFYVEDRLFMLDLFPRIRRIAFVDVDLYYYLQYDTSILHSRKRHDGPGYKSAMLDYLRRLTALIDSPSTPSSAVTRLSAVRDTDSFRLIHNVLRYCNTHECSASFSLLTSLGAYPLAPVDPLVALTSQTPRTSLASRLASAPNRVLRSLMNRRGLWLLLCRLYHLLPQGLRSRL